MLSSAGTPRIPRTTRAAETRPRGLTLQDLHIAPRVVLGQRLIFNAPAVHGHACDVLAREAAGELRVHSCAGSLPLRCLQIFFPRSVNPSTKEWRATQSKDGSTSASARNASCSATTFATMWVQIALHSWAAARAARLVRDRNWGVASHAVCALAVPL